MADDTMEGDALAGSMLMSSAAGAGNSEQRLFDDDDDDIARQRQFDEAIQVLLEQGHHRLVQRVHLILQQSQIYEAMRVLHDDEEEDAVADDEEGHAADPALDEFRRLLNRSALDFHFAGYSHDDIFHVLPILVLVAARRTAGFLDHVSPSSHSHTAARGAAAGALFEYPEEQDQFDEAMRTLAERGRHDVVQLVLRCLEQRHDYVEAMRVVNHHHGNGMADRLVGEFRRQLRDHVLRLLFFGYEEHAVSDLFHVIVLLAVREAAGFRDRDSETTHQSSYSNGGGGGFGAVPAPAAAVARLEKRRFHAGGDGAAAAAEGCSVCFEDFVDGEEVSVMPCPLRGHEFHPNCIAKWLGISNLCPLCRHGLDGSAPPASSMVAEPDRVAEESRARRHGPTVEPRRRSTRQRRRHAPTVEPRRSSTRQRRPNVRTSGPEWDRHGPYLR